MKDGFFRLSAAFALIFYLGNVARAADYAQSLLAGQRTLDMYLERAKVQSSQERFEELAKQGQSAALLEWEQNTLDLKAAGLEDWIFERERLKDAMGQRSEGFLAEWVLERKKSQVEDIKKSRLYSELRDLADGFFYVDQDGKESRVVSKENILEAKAQYQEQAQEIIKKYVDKDSPEKTALDAYLIESQALNELTNKLLYDHDSLKRMSDSEAALFIADKLASQIEAESQSAIDRLFNSLQSQVDFVDAQDLEAKKDLEQNWLGRFENELSMGLKKWSDAEEEFLQARSDWEKTAESVYLNDNQKWQEAYDDLQNRKIAWSQKIEAQIQEGRAEWSHKLDVLGEEIDQSLREFQNALLWENEQKKQIVQSQEESYAQSRAILQSAQNGVELWYERWGEKYKGLYSYWKTEDSEFGQKLDISLVGTSYLKNQILSWKDNFAKSIRSLCPQAACSQNSSADQIETACQTIMQSKYNQARLSPDYWECLKDARLLWNASYEIIEWLDLYDTFKRRANEALYALYSDSCANIEIVDELSSEKAKASWLVDYWQSRVNVAQEVADYAKNAFSDLEWAQETERNLGEALDAYNAAKDAYQKAFDEAQEKRLDVLEKRDQYYQALDDTENLLKKIDLERKSYDEIYQERLDALDLISQDPTLELLYELQSLNYQSEDFKKYLCRYCLESQEEHDKALSEKKDFLRSVVVEGFDNLEGDEQNPSASCLSIARLEEIGGCLNEVLAAPVLDLKKAKPLFEDLKKLSGEAFAKLEEKVQAFEQGKASAGDIRLELNEFLSLAQKECDNRYAILLLLDGCLEEIREFFDGNEDFGELFQNYKEYSSAVAQEEALASAKALREAVAGGQEDGLEAYFERLDIASQGASAFTLSALEMYKNLILCKNDCQSLENDLALKLASCFSLPGKISSCRVKWFLDECEEFLGQKADYEEPADYDKASFERLSFGRKDLLLKIQDGLGLLLQRANDAQTLDLSLSDQGGAVQAAQKEYEKSLDAISMGKSGSRINQYIASCQLYNQALETSQSLYEKLEDARRNYRLAQEIYFYGQNEYLHNSYDPNAILTSSKDSLKKAQAALDALNQIEQEKAGEVLDDYKAECINYYKGRVMLFEYDQRVASQTKSLYRAQAAERAAVEKLVSECAPQGCAANVSAFTKDLVVASVDQDGNYSFSLNKELRNLPQENKDTLLEYFSNYCFVQTDIYQNEYRSTQAAKDALDFLESLQSKPYSLTDLAFCALQIKGWGNASQKSEWFNDGENPAANENYKIGDLPDTVHGVNAAEAYRGERLRIIQETYAKVIALGGEEDIAKYILYCDQNFSKDLDLDKLCKNALAAAALEGPLKNVLAEGKHWSANGKTLLASAAMYFLITCLPFGWGAWAWGPATALAAAGAACLAVSDQLYEYAEDMKSVKNGCSANYAVLLADYQKSILDWKRSKDRVAEEEEKLSLLLTGKKGGGGGKITWDDFKRSLQEAFDPGTLGVGSSYFMSIHDSSDGQKGIKDFFEELSAKEDFYDVRSVMEKMALVLQDNYSQKKKTLQECVDSREGDLRFDTASYYKDMLSFYSKDLLRNLPSAMNRNCEDYIAEIFDAYKSLSEEVLNYSAKNRFTERRDDYSLIYADFDQQFSLWNDKNALILETAQEDWLLAKEQINASYNEWQKEFSNEYQRSSASWADNYQEFLDKKEDWLFRQYLSSGGDADVSYSLVKNLKSTFDQEGLNEKFVDSICDLEKFSRLAELTSAMSSIAKNESSPQVFFEKMDASLIKDFDCAVKAQRELQQSQQAAAAKTAAQYCQANLEKSLDERMESIKSKNKSVEKWELDMVRQAGYEVDPFIHRNAIIDVSFLSTKRTRQEVHRYEWFTPSAPSVDLNASSYAGSNEYYIMKKVEDAQKKIQEWSEQIFGNGSSPQSGGRLAEHIGTAPVFIQNVDPTKSRESNVKDYGSGQMGKILLDYQWNSIVSAAASSELSKAIYDQKLIDIGGFSLPSFREIAGIVLDIVSNATGILPLQFLDDTVFGIIDVQMGYKSWDEVVSGFVKKGLASGVSSGISALGNAAGKALKNASAFFKGGAGSQVLNGMQNAATGYLNNVASSYVNAFDFASGKMDWDMAASSWLDASAISNSAGSFLGHSLGAFNNLDANGLALNSRVFGNIQSMNASIGSLAGQAFNYLATGDFSVNLLNVKGVGLLEIGVSDGALKAGVGRGGADLSLQKIAAFSKGAKDAARVSSLKSGSREDQTLLNAANLLALSGGKDNVQLASDLFNQKRRLLFEDASGEYKFGRTLDDAIILDKALLSQGKEGQALAASYAALQNLAQKEASFSYDDIDFSKLKKSDGSNYTQDEIQKIKNKLKTDSTLNSMAQISAALSSASEALGLGLDFAQANDSLSHLANAYKQGGMAGVYAFYAESQEQAADKGAEGGLAQLLEQPWHQNVQENRGVLLGQSLSMEEYNKLAKENAVERYVAKELDAYKAKKKNKASLSDLERIEREARAKAESEIVEGVANQKYEYQPETYSLDIKNYGCTLATAAYIAYSITGSVTTLSQANDILNKQDLYLYGTDKNGVTQKNLIGAGDSYAAAVNAIAGGDYLQKDGNDFSVAADIKAGEKLVDNRQNIFSRLVENSKSQSDVYFTHLRINDKHSVLFDSMTYDDQNDYKSSKLSVMDPWKGGDYGPKSWSDVSRADFYKLTQAGKEIYELTRINLRDAS